MRLVKPSWWFWIVALFALLWNAMGAANMYDQIANAGLFALPEDYKAYIATRPMWATVGFAVSVVFGILGALAMFMRSGLTTFLFFVSFIGTAVAFAHIYMSSGFVANQGFLSTLAALVVAGLLYILASRAKGLRWIG